MESKVIEDYGVKLNLNGAENYLFCGALSRTFQSIGEKDFDYWFFSGVTGDIFTQVFSRGFDKYYDCLSSAIFGKPHLDRIFETCGYGYTLVENTELHANCDKYFYKVKEWIDNDVPVIVKENDDSWYSLAVGYRDSGRTILKFNLLDDELQEYEFGLTESSNYSLVFVGDKVKEIHLTEIYRKAVFDIPSLLNAESTQEVSFGKQAFIDWSESLLNGRYEYISDYIMWVGTNGHMVTFLDRAAKMNPDLSKTVERINAISKITNAEMYAYLVTNAERAFVTKDKAIIDEISAKIKGIIPYYIEIGKLLDK